ncbi:MAG: DNA replication/repair protein RecF [Eubacteriales bacterium]|nr:DNA replication/repair protein RecF [Eubacteriales bacterium]
MFVRGLELENFRNYRRLELDFSRRNNLICGANAQGKTNILEAIYLASCARSHRTGKDRELIFHGEDNYKVKVFFTRDNGSEAILEIDYRQANSKKDRGQSGEAAKRVILVDNFPLERISDLFGQINAVIFAPDDLMLIKEGPAGRRRFLDILISQISPSYFRQLQVYQRLLKQRNSILKQARDQCPGLDVEARKWQRLNFEVWDQQLADSAAALIKKRVEICAELKASAAKAMDLISDQREDFSIRYIPPRGVDGEASEAEISEAFFRRISRNRDEDILRGFTQDGPHRDDLEFLLNGFSAKIYASQGQQRSLVLALKMAELEVIERHCDVKAILLLDDVMSELDEKRRENILQIIDNHQVFVTCTDFAQISPQIFARPEANAWFRVEAGKAWRVDPETW